MRSVNLGLLALANLLHLAHSQVMCIQGILSTISYEPALVAHATDAANACPTDYYSATNNGCCASSATPHVVNAGVACCPCGASCTGYLPAPMAWESKDGRLVFTATTSGTQVMTEPTNQVATPGHGPSTGTGSVDMNTAPGPVSLSGHTPLPYSSSPTPANATIRSTTSATTTTTGTESGFIGSSTGGGTGSRTGSSSTGAASQTASGANAGIGMDVSLFAAMVGFAFLGVVAG